MSKKLYEAPQVAKLGTVEELTQQEVVKLSGSADAFCPRDVVDSPDLVVCVIPVS